MASGLGRLFGNAFKRTKKPPKEITNPRHPKPDTSKMDPKAAKKTEAAWRRNELNGAKRGFDHQGYANKGKLDRIGGHGGTQLGIGVAGIGVTAGVMAATGGGQAVDPNAAGQAVDPNAPPPDPSAYPPDFGNAAVQTSYADSGYGSPYASPNGSQYGSTSSFGSFDSGYASPTPYSSSPGLPVYDPNLNGGRGGMTPAGGYMP